MRAESVVQHQELLVERRAESAQLDGANWRHEREELLRLPETLVLAHGPHLLSGGKDEFEEDREGAVRVRVLHEEASVALLHKRCKAGDLAPQVGEFGALEDVDQTPEER